MAMHEPPLASLHPVQARDAEADVRQFAGVADSGAEPLDLHHAREVRPLIGPNAIECDQLPVAIAIGRTAGGSHHIVEPDGERAEWVAQADIWFRGEQIGPRLSVASHDFAERRMATLDHRLQG